MTDYADIPQANALRQEQELVQSAITMIDGGGSMASFVITPPPTPPGETPTGTFMMAASVSTMGTPPSSVTMMSIRDWLIQRSSDINAALAAIGVTDTPPEPNPQAPPGLFDRS